MRNNMTTFETVIKLLEEYKREHGDLLVPEKYATADGVNIGSIVREIRKGDRKITAEEKEKLDELGFVWKCREDFSFKEIIEMFNGYKKEYDDLLVPIKYVTEEGIKLGSIVNGIRNGHRKTTAEEKRKLDELGFVWKCRDRFSFEEIIEMLKEYKSEHGDLLVPQKYVTTDGVILGNIVGAIRTGHRKTTVEEKRKLDEIGFVWKGHRGLSFEAVFETLKEYKREHGDLLVPQKYVTTEGIKLGKIVNSLRNGDRKTTPEQKVELDKMGFVWRVC